MIIRLSATLAILLAVAAGVVRTDRQQVVPASFATPAVAGELIVRLKPTFTGLSDAALSRHLGGQVVERLADLDSVRLKLGPSETPENAVARLERSPYVLFAEPNHIVRATMVPNDPFFTAQAAYLNLVEASQAWDIEQGVESVLVAVLDTGIDLDHPDLKGKIWSNPREIDANNIDDDDDGCIDDMFGCSFVTANASDPSCGAPSPALIKDDSGHGTFIAGIIAAQGNNGLGVIGIAPGVRVLPVKILDCTGGGTAAQAAQGLLYAARLGARVANVSFGADGESMTLTNAIREARNKYGMVIVATTGNSGRKGVSFPARLPEVIAVASSGTAVDPVARSPFSDWGPEVSVAAPGLNVVSTVPLDQCAAWRCAEGQPYAIASGTSFAAPMVSGLAALLISRTPNLSPDAVTRIITSTAQPLPDEDTPNWDGAGRIRMRAALSQPRYFLGVAGVSRQ